MAPGASRAGCASAVWSSGSPSESYCGGGNGRFPWFAACCEWQDGTCETKGDISYNKRNGKSCNQRTTVLVSTLGEAMALCTRDDDCGAVYDYKDDGLRNFVLCREGFTMSNAGNNGGAVYEKARRVEVPPRA